MGLFSDSARKRLAKRLECRPDEVDERARRMIDASDISGIADAISNEVQEASKTMCEQVNAGSHLSEGEVDKTFLRAWFVGRTKGRTPNAEEPYDPAKTSPPPLPGPARVTVATQTVAGEIDLSGPMEALQNATFSEMAEIDRELAEGADIEDTEIRIRLLAAIDKVKFAIVCATALALCFAGWAMAADKAPWPQKGDVLYLSARLPGRSSPMFLGAKMQDLLVLEPCLPVTIEKRTDASDFFRIKDESGKRMLEGPWLTRMHKTEKECKETFSTKGQPHLEAKGYRYLLIDDLPPKPL